MTSLKSKMPFANSFVAQLFEPSYTFIITLSRWFTTKAALTTQPSKNLLASYIWYSWIAFEILFIERARTQSERQRKHGSSCSSVKPNEFGKLSKLSFCFIQSPSPRQSPFFLRLCVGVCDYFYCTRIHNDRKNKNGRKVEGREKNNKNIERIFPTEWWVMRIFYIYIFLMLFVCNVYYIQNIFWLEPFTHRAQIE